MKQIVLVIALFGTGMYFIVEINFKSVLVDKLTIFKKKILLNLATMRVDKKLIR
jgi:hypothetical protein